MLMLKRSFNSFAFNGLGENSLVIIICLCVWETYPAKISKSWPVARSTILVASSKSLPQSSEILSSSPNETASSDLGGGGDRVLCLLEGGGVSDFLDEKSVEISSS